MKLIPSLLFLSQGISLVLGQDDFHSESCAVYVSTQYVTVAETIYASSPSDTMHPSSGSNGKYTTSLITETVTQVTTKTIAPETITQRITETLAPQTVTQVVTKTLVPQTITQVTTETVTPNLETVTTLTPLYTNTTMNKSPTTSPVKIPLSSLTVYPTNSTLISPTNSTSILLATPSACYDGCALVAISSPSGCSSIFQTTIYPSTVTKTVYTTAFPSNITLSQVISTETLIETISFTSEETLTTTTIYESTTALTNTVTDNTLTVTSTTGTTTITAISSAPVKKRRTSSQLFTSSLSNSNITVSPERILPSPCTDSAAYSSACSCAGVSHVTTTLPIPTVTITSTLNGTFTVTNNLTATTQATTSVTTLLTSEVDYTSTVNVIATFDTTATATIDVVASTTATPSATGNAYCSNGSIVDGLSAPCTSEPCIAFNLRIEGYADTIYEGPIYTGPQDITTTSGGTHVCNGQNYNANPSAGGTAITALNSAAGLCNFSFDGTYYSAYSDFFITSIGDSTQASSMYWGLLNNYDYTSTGGCETEPAAGDTILWAYNAFNAVYFLDVTPKTASVDVGTVVVFTVKDGTTGVPVSGASFNGLTTDENGQVNFVATTPGSFRYKATRSDCIRSPAVEITVAQQLEVAP